MLDDFNREYETPSPGPDVLTARLQRLLAGGDVVAILIGDPAAGVGLLTLRPNVWYAGPVGLLDELYVVPNRRGRGLGSALLRAAEQVVRERGGEALEINVDGDDAAARRFYERHGYRNSEPGKDEQLLYYFESCNERFRGQRQTALMLPTLDSTQNPASLASAQPIQVQAANRVL